MSKDLREGRFADLCDAYQEQLEETAAEHLSVVVPTRKQIPAPLPGRTLTLEDVFAYHGPRIPLRRQAEARLRLDEPAQPAQITQIDGEDDPESDAA